MLSLTVKNGGLYFKPTTSDSCFLTLSSQLHKIWQLKAINTLLVQQTGSQQMDIAFCFLPQMFHLGNCVNCPFYRVLCGEAQSTWMRAVDSLVSAFREPAALGVTTHNTWITTASLGKWKQWNTSCLKLQLFQKAASAGSRTRQFRSVYQL